MLAEERFAAILSILQKQRTVTVLELTQALSISESTIRRENEAYMAFGDSMNDCEMLQEAAVGVAMGNAMDAVKAYADHICGSSDTPAIHDTLQAYGLIH